MWSVTDWRTDELFLTLNNHEKGIYRELLDECWINGSISDSPEVLALLCRESVETMAALWAKVSSKFPYISQGRVTSKRLEKDRKRLEFIRSERRKAGQLGGIANAKQMRSKQEAKGKQKVASAYNYILNQSDSIEASAIAKRSQTQTADSRLQTREENTPSATADRFDVFWQGSTRRGSKKDALTEWRKLPDVERTSGKIESGMAAWQASEQWQDETKQPHIVRWLRRRGWEELVPHRNGNGNGALKFVDNGLSEWEKIVRGLVSDFGHTREKAEEMANKQGWAK